MTQEDNGWGEWKKYVLMELKRVGDQTGILSKQVTQLLGETAMVSAELASLSRQVSQVCEEAHSVRELATRNRNDLARLSVKAGLWGALGATIPSGLAILLQLLK